MTGTIRYRVGQFVRALTATVSQDESEDAMRILTLEAQALFHRQTIQDQRHAVTVYHGLRQAGHINPQLLAAALLHDVGKAATRIPSWQQAVIVLLERFAPRLLARLSRGELVQRWRRPFVVHARHPQVGARWAQEAGCSPLTVALIRRHQERLATSQAEEDQLLAALQAADRLS